EWYFTLITGTNRLKTFPEITSDENKTGEDNIYKIKVQGVDELKKILVKLHENESVSWIIHPAQSISSPPQEMIDEIKTFTHKINIQFYGPHRFSIPNRCSTDSDCDNIDCSSYDSPVKEGYKPYCVNSFCQCMCYGCE
ncbi:MAG: hypothetical protein QQN41_09065, partial [Nitrosopumilus sp.]